MIEQQLPIEIPPGLVMNGSLMERAGRWENGNYVRFHNGIARPMGEAVQLTTHGSAIPTTGGVPKGMYRWYTQQGGDTVVVAQHTTMYSMTNFARASSGNDVDPITPASAPADEGDVNGWSFANLGETVLITACGWPEATDPISPLWTYDISVGAAVLELNDGRYRGVFVTPESFPVLISGINTLKWASQGTFDTWTPAVGNSAGSLDVPSPYLVISGRPLVGESLVWTTGDLWALNYVGGDLVYGLRKVGDNCGILGANNVAITNGVARWMGPGGFFEYDGYVRPLECPLSEFVFGDIARTHVHRFFTVQLPQFSAIQFWYMSGVGGDWCDRFVEYNYANGTWTKGENIYRSAGVGEWPIDVDSSATGARETVPLMAGPSTNVLYLHEQDTGVLTSENGADDPLTPHLRSGPIHMPEGKMVKVQKVYPDSAGVGDKVTLYEGFLPNETEGQFGPYTVAATSQIDTRFAARYVRYQQTLEDNDSSVGIPRLGIIPGGSGR